MRAFNASHKCLNENQPHKGTEKKPDKQSSSHYYTDTLKKKVTASALMKETVDIRAIVSTISTMSPQY